MSKNSTTSQTAAESPTSQTEFSERSPLLRGIEVRVNGRKMIMPSALMSRGVDLAEATERLTAGELLPSAYLRVRNQVVEETLRRNYPSLSDHWFSQLDTGEYLRLANASTEAAGLGEETAANP